MVSGDVTRRCAKCVTCQLVARKPAPVKIREPDAGFVLQPGETVAFPPRRHHFVEGVNQQSCQFLAIQGVSTYDYVPADD